ncbi:TonB-dependent receptor [Flavobacterium sp. TMP13]|uniref:TonB-dependent receptor n=1 Tax=Flavobacterium sp. TMP13 TaxID=3425950 RepID=UPI003D7743D1
MIPKKYYFLNFLLLCFVNISAQNKSSKKIDTLTTEKLQEVIISPLHINTKLQNAPASIGILSQADLAQNNSTDISTVLNIIPGVFMQSANFTTSRISIRGIGARTPYGTNKIRAFYGSIPLTSGNSETVIDDIDLETLNQIEIIKGPLSSVYGAGLGGAILISPKLSTTIGQSASISTVVGSNSLLKNTFNYNLNKEKASVNLSYHKLETDGWRENSAYNREGITLAVELLKKANSKLTYFSNYTYLKAFIPSSISKDLFENNPKSGAATWVASKGYKEYKSTLAGLAYDFQLNDNLQNSTSIFVNYKDNNEARPFDILKQYTFASGARTQFSGKFKIKNVANHFITGIEYFQDTYKGNTFENLYKQNNNQGSLQGNSLTETGQKRQFYNVFSQIRTLLAEQFEVQAGINYNATQFEIENYNLKSTEKYSYGGIFSPQLSLLFNPSTERTIYLSASRGFSLPATEETLSSTGTINTGIKPENGYNFEMGGKFYFFSRKLYTEVSLYRMEIKDLLVAKRVGDDQYVGANAGKTLHEGVEILANYNWKINSFLDIQSHVSASVGNYKFKEFDDNGTDFSGNKLTGVPASKANVGVLINTTLGIYLSGDFQYIDDIPLNDANSVYANSYRVLNVKTGYRFEILPKWNAHLAAGVNNATNEKYATLILPNAVAFGKALPRYYYPGLPVNYYGSVALNYLF